MSEPQNQKPRGRPRYDQTGGAYVQVTAKVPTAIYNQLTMTAHRTKLPLSAVVRRLLHPDFGKHK